MSYVEIGSWLTGLPRDELVRVRTKEDVFAVAASRVTRPRPLYLEFGVWRGGSMRWWSQHLRQPDARLVGFDSFEGLPHDWKPSIPKGQFDVGGSLPCIDDPRVTFVKGWFEETLPAFDLPQHDQLVVNIDADLYSSTATVLSHLDPHLRPGTLIYFDEFPDGEKQAFSDALSRRNRCAVPLAYSATGRSWLFAYR